MEFRILGGLEVRRDGRPLPLGRGRQRLLLALLLLRRNQVVSSDRLIDELWGDAPPRTAQTALQGHVGQLRKLLGRERVSTHEHGYLLHVEDGELDAERFELLLGAGRAAEALGLWRGPALSDCGEAPFVQAASARLGELRLVALERRLEEDLEAGRSAEAVAELEALVAEHALRERLRFLLMLGLYRSGRQADGLAAYQQTRRVLVEQLGIEPSAELRELHRRMLAHDPALAGASNGERALEPVRRLERRTITVVHAGLAATAPSGRRIDPEAYHPLLERFIGACTAAIERHGGTVAGYPTGAVLGSFGLQQAREDDALRALRAASDCAAGTLELQARVGVATGELLTGGHAARLTGEAIDVAARLRGQAKPGAVVFDEETHCRCRNAVSAEAVEVRLDGGPEAVAAYVLDELIEGAPSFRRRFETPLVGRERELADLGYAFERAVEERRASVALVLGVPGIGKTRLALELTATLGERATVLEGRCLPYGDGVTFWPLRELILAAFGRDDPLGAMAEALAGEDDAEAVAAQIASSVGLADGEPTTELFWAVRRLIETLARREPLVLVLEDLHWAEAAFLDLVQYLATYVREAPVLLLCLARPKLVEERPGWPGGEPAASPVRLEPLTARESHALAGHLAHEVAPELRARIVATAEGNPLFLEQMLVHAVEEEGELEVPSTLRALLAERIDHLTPGERAAVEAAAVVGPDFWPEAVEELLPFEARASLGRHLSDLVARDLVRPHPSARFPRGFRFGHILVRDAAYERIPKRARAELHERLASWLAARPDEQDELIGYHLEQVYGYLAELGPVDAHAERLGADAAERLGGAGMRAFARGDVAASVSLLTRALALISEDDERRPKLLVPVGRALWRLGRLPEARRAQEEALTVARRLGDTRNAARAELWLLQTRWSLEKVIDLEAMEGKARAVAERFESASDHAAAHEAWTVVHHAASYRLQHASSLDALERAIRHAHRNGSVEAPLAPTEIILHVGGAMPTSGGIARARELLESGLGKAAEAFVLDYIAPLLAMRGDFASARQSVRRALVFWREAGTLAPDMPDWLGEASMVELLSGDWASAERTLRLQCEQSERPGREPVFATFAGFLAHCLLEQGRDDEALGWTTRSEAAAPRHDTMSQVLWQSARARALARAGSRAEAATLARAAVELAETTDWLWGQADAHRDLGEVLCLAGRSDQAAGAVAEALACYERKEHLVGAERARRFMAALG